jgi:hypothetical protein
LPSGLEFPYDETAMQGFYVSAEVTS